MPGFELKILYEDNHCLAVAKPAGTASAHDDGGHRTMVDAAKAYLKNKYSKPGQVFLGIVHRLDKKVSGVLLFAKTSKGAARLSEQFRENSVEKIYWCVVDGVPQTATGSLEDWLWKPDDQGHVQIVHAEKPGARHSLLHFEQKGQCQGMSWLEIRPQTGRRHQIRVQLAHRGMRIVGDAKYGSVHMLDHSIALHARRLTFLHPIRYEPIALTCALPALWRRRFAELFRGVDV